jgi:hypothetical protein
VQHHGEFERSLGEFIPKALEGVTFGWYKQGVQPCRRCMLSLSNIQKRARHPFETLFVDLGRHSPDKALALLTVAMREEPRDTNAYEWITRVLPGATLKPALAFGSIGELYRSYTRPAEFERLKHILRA